MKRFVKILTLLVGLVCLAGCGSRQESPENAEGEKFASAPISATGIAAQNAGPQINGEGLYVYSPVTVNASSGYVQFAVQNYNSQNIELNLPAMTVPAGFKIDSRSGCYARPVLQPNASCVLGVAFAPTEVGSYAGVLSIPYGPYFLTRELRGEAIPVNRNDPGVPRIISAISSSPGTVNVTFEADSRNTNRYQLYFSTNGNVFGPITAAPEERSFFAVGLAKGATYAFQVVAVNPAEDKVYSNQPSTRIAAGGDVAPPMSRILSVRQSRQLYVGWETVANRATIHHFELMNSQNSQVVIADRDASAIPAPALKNGPVTFTLVTVSLSGNRSTSAPVTVSASREFKSAEIPVLFAQAGPQNGTVRLNWVEFPENVDHFKVYCSFDGQLNGPIHRPANEREFLVTGLPDGKVITFQIVAESADGLRSYSNQPVATTNAPAIRGANLQLTNGQSALSEVRITRPRNAGISTLDITLQNFGEMEVTGLSAELQLPFAQFFRGYIYQGGFQRTTRIDLGSKLEKNSSRVLTVAYEQVGQVPVRLEGTLSIYGNGDTLLRTIPVILETL